MEVVGVVAVIGGVGLENDAGVESKKEREQQEHDGADAATGRHGPAKPGPVLDVLAPPTHRPTHGSSFGGRLIKPCVQKAGR